MLGAAFDAPSFSKIRVELREYMENVFLSLEQQCEDKYERQFINELKSECTILLDKDLRWLARLRFTKFVDLTSPDAKQKAIQLHSDQHFFGKIPQPAVDEIRALASNDLDRFRLNAAAGKLTREDLSINAGANVRAICDVLNREFKSISVLDAVSAYASRKIRVTGLAVELSVPQATWWRNAITLIDRPPKTLYAHIDEGIAFPKSIVYLSDVVEESGPTSCYPGAYQALTLTPLQELIGRIIGNIGSKPGSSLFDFYGKLHHRSVNSENFRRHFMRLPESLRFNSHFGWDVRPECKLEEELVRRERKMIGPAGTFIVFDGAKLLHRGGLIERNERIALQVIFSDLTFAQRVASKVRRVFL